MKRRSGLAGHIISGPAGNRRAGPIFLKSIFNAFPNICKYLLFTLLQNYVHLREFALTHVILASGARGRGVRAAVSYIVFGEIIPRNPVFQSVVLLSKTALFPPKACPGLWAAVMLFLFEVHVNCPGAWIGSPRLCLSRNSDGMNRMDSRKLFKYLLGLQELIFGPKI